MPKLKHFLESHIQLINHVHLSNPNLRPFGNDLSTLIEFANTLRKGGYSNYCSLEQVNEGNEPELIDQIILAHNSFTQATATV